MNLELWHQWEELSYFEYFLHIKFSLIHKHRKIYYGFCVKVWKSLNRLMSGTSGQNHIFFIELNKPSDEFFNNLQLNSFLKICKEIWSIVLITIIPNLNDILVCIFRFYFSWLIVCLIQSSFSIEKLTSLLTKIIPYFSKQFESLILLTDL